jgi:hypothetical protein
VQINDDSTKLETDLVERHLAMNRSSPRKENLVPPVTRASAASPMLGTGGGLTLIKTAAVVSLEPPRRRWLRPGTVSADEEVATDANAPHHAIVGASANDENLGS